VQRIVYASVVTIDAAGRPRVRVLHPVWEGSVGWVVTGRHSQKAKHVDANPHVSLSYVQIAPDFGSNCVYAECRADWIEDVAEKRRVFDVFKSFPKPYGWDPAPESELPPGFTEHGWFIGTGPEDPGQGVLRLTPWRIEVSSMWDEVRGDARVWRP
jgi:hypothetical protein